MPGYKMTADQSIEQMINGLTREPTPWAARGACVGADPSLFYLPRGERTAEAKAICRTCEVITECREYAVNNHEKFGIWGGTDEKERRRIRATRLPRAS